MKNFFKSKSFAVGALSVLVGITIIIFAPQNNEFGISLITTGLGTITLRHAISKGSDK